MADPEAVGKVGRLRVQMAPLGAGTRPPVGDGGARRLNAAPSPSSQAFTDHYYATFDSNRQALIGLYQDQSMMTFEGQKFQGPQQVGNAAAAKRRARHAPF
jgi:hypothetical protein